MDFLWRRRAAQVVKRWSPKDILDVATGSGDLALTLQRHCSGASVTGSDFCPPMLREARRKGLEKVVEADALDLPFADGAFDVVTVAFGLRNMRSYIGALREMRRVLRPGGHVLVLDFSLPGNRPFRAVYRRYLHHVLPLLAGLVTGDRNAYRYLGDSIENFPSGEVMCRLMEESGFRKPTCEPLTGGIVSLYVAES